MAKDIYSSLDLQKVNELLNARQQNVTTSERSTLASGLGATHKGLFVYDTDLSTAYVWDGSAFQTYTPVIAGAMTYKGAYTSLTTTPTTPAVGDVYVFTGTPGTLTWATQTFSPSADVEVGDSIIYRGANVWDIFQKNDVAASETVSGNIEIATQAETDAGTDDARAITALKLKTFANNKKIPLSYYQEAITLVTNTPFTVTHNLNLTNKDAFSVRVANSAGSEIEVDIDSVGVNSFTITAQPGATGVKVYVNGQATF